MKLRSKILSYTLPLILIPFLLMAVAVYYFVIRANQIQLQEQKSQSLNEAIINFGQEMDAARKDITLLASVPAIKEYLLDVSQSGGSDSNSTSRKDHAKTVLELFFKQNPYYLELSLVDEKGQERIKFSKIPNEQELRNIKNEEHFRRTLISGTFQTPVQEVQPPKYATIFAQSIYTERFIGMLVLSLNTEIFERTMRPLIKRDLNTFLFDDRGVVFASGFNSKKEKDLLKNVNLANEASKLLANSSFDSNQKIIENEKGKYLLSFLPAESIPGNAVLSTPVGSNWFLGVFEPQKATIVPPVFQAIFFLILIPAIGAVLFLTAKASKYITIPLEKVSTATNKIARGESNLELDIKTGDEVEELANAVMSMNHDLQDYQKQIVQSAKLASMGEMTSEISHEIQNRISGISLWLQHLDSEIEENDPRQEYLDEMKLGLKGFMEMLANLKEYYKKPALVLKDVDLNLLIKETLPFVEEKVIEKKIEINAEFFANSLMIKADGEKLKGVILNFLLNSIESVEKNGKIKVRTDSNKVNNTIYFEVIDNGSGIEEEDMTRIFYPFYSKKSGGSGLGLAISSNIISAHNGRIEVESEVGKGTTFKVFLRSE